MKKQIEIDIVDKYDFIEKYNENKVSSNILDYIIKETMFMGKREDIKIIINKKCIIDKECSKMLKEGLKDKYTRSLLQCHSNNVKQLWLLILGIGILFLSRLIQDDSIWKEVFLICGWVPIWEMVELELFPDTEARRKRRIIKKLLRSEIIEKKFIEELI